MITTTKKPNATNNNNGKFPQEREGFQKVAPHGLPVVDGVPEELHQKISANQNHSSNAKKKQERTLAIIGLNDDLEGIIHHIKEHDFTISKKIHLYTSQVKNFYQNHQKELYNDKYSIRLNDAIWYALILEKENAIDEWKTLMGPCNYNESGKNYPNSIRARFAKDGLQCIIYGSDSEEHAKREIDFVFSLGLTSNGAQDVKTDTNCVEQQAQKDGSQLELKTSCSSNSEHGATIYLGETARATVSSVKEKANNILDPNIDVISSIDKTNQEKSTLKPEASVVPTSADGINIIHKDQSAIDITSKGEAIQLDKNNAGDKSIDKTASIDKIKDKNTNDHQEAEGKIETPAVATIGSSTVPARNVKKNVNHDKNNCSDDIQVNQSENNTDITFTTKRENEVVTEDSSTIPRSKEEQEFDSIAIDNKEKNSMGMPLTKEKEDSQVQHEAIKNHEISDEEKETILAQKNEQDSSKKHEKPFASSDRIASSDNVASSDKVASIDKEDMMSKEKVHKLQTTPTSSAKNKLLTRSIKGDITRPSSSRIPPPSIKRNQQGTMISSPKSLAPSTKHLVAPEQRLRTTSISGTKTKGHVSAGTTRIARLSSISSANSSSSSDQEKKPPVVTKTQAMKPLTKVSKRLPRVATIASTQKPILSEQSNNSTVEKPKKKVSSTESVFTRLSAPTLASAKKFEHHDIAIQKSTPGVARRTTPAKKQFAVKCSNSTSMNKPKQRKKPNPSDSSAVIDKISTKNSDNNANTGSDVH